MGELAPMVLACCLIATLACGTAPPSGLTTYRDGKRGIQFEHPSDWTVEEVTEQDVLLVMSPVVESNWQANVFVELRTDLDPDEPMQGRLEALAGHLAQHKDAFALTSSRSISHASGLAAGELVYTHVMEGVALTEREVVLWLPGGQTLFVTGSAVTSLWEKYESDLDAVLTSVRPL